MIKDENHHKTNDTKVIFDLLKDRVYAKVCNVVFVDFILFSSDRIIHSLSLNRYWWPSKLLEKQTVTHDPTLA